jgi:hypothetical protein
MVWRVIHTYFSVILGERTLDISLNSISDIMYRERIQVGNSILHDVFICGNFVCKDVTVVGKSLRKMERK